MNIQISYFHTYIYAYIPLIKFKICIISFIYPSIGLCMLARCSADPVESSQSTYLKTFSIAFSSFCAARSGGCGILERHSVCFFQTLGMLVVL